MTDYWCAAAWLPPGRVASDVVVTADGPRITRVVEGAAAPAGAQRLCGLVLPGLADAHSHAFHRALRGRTHGGGGTFWTWREAMYAVAERLDPDIYLALARATFAEMALAGVTCVGEFHYLHHDARGVAYADANVMGHALVEAARAAGLRICLLDTCYLTGGIGQPLCGVQHRFGDGDADGWAARAQALAAGYRSASDVVIGSAVHSVRAVPAEQIPAVAAWASRHQAPLHAHLSEQQAENDACAAAHGRTPAQLLHERGVTGPGATVVHAIHLTDRDVRLLGSAGTRVCACPTTERDLADGIGRFRALHTAGSPLALGSDSHAVIDLFEEARAIEYGERLATRTRGHWSAGQLLDAASAAGHAALGFPDAGALAPGAWADLVTLRLDSVRVAGAAPDGGAGAADAVVFAASAADVTDVVAGGRRIVEGGVHTLLGDVAGPLADAVRGLRA